MSGARHEVLLLALLPSVAILALRGDYEAAWNIGSSCVFALLGYILTVVMIPNIAEMTLARGLGGIDLNKVEDLNAPGFDRSKHKKVPEALGLVVGIVYLICVILHEAYTKFYLSNNSNLSDFNAALHSICFMLLLGFSDDVLDLRWRYKLLLPAAAGLPLLMSYSGVTTVVVPVPLRALFGTEHVDLGFLYFIYMLMIAIFCTNAINIYAGINGLEAGQSACIACAVILHNVFELQGSDRNLHLFSISLLIPFFAGTLGLLKYNGYPSRVFVGDTYTYFAGMTFAVVAILGHFSKTLMLFLMPQIFNFVYSLYQILIGPMLFGVKCPRHRLPKFNASTGLLHGVPTHHNLVNLTLLITGPLHERTLCQILLALQLITCALGFVVRYYVADYFYNTTNWA